MHKNISLGAFRSYLVTVKLNKEICCMIRLSKAMVLFPSLLDGLAGTVSIKKGRNSRKDAGRVAAEALAKDARKNELMLSSSGNVKSSKSDNFASVCSKRGQKGINQDSSVVWEVRKTL